MYSYRKCAHPSDQLSRFDAGRSAPAVQVPSKPPGLCNQPRWLRNTTAAPSPLNRALRKRRLILRAARAWALLEGWSRSRRGQLPVLRIVGRIDPHSPPAALGPGSISSAGHGSASLTRLHEALYLFQRHAVSCARDTQS